MGITYSHPVPDVTGHYVSMTIRMPNKLRILGAPQHVLDAITLVAQ